MAPPLAHAPLSAHAPLYRGSGERISGGSSVATKPVGEVVHRFQPTPVAAARLERVGFPEPMDDIRQTRDFAARPRADFSSRSTRDAVWPSLRRRPYLIAARRGLSRACRTPAERNRCVIDTTCAVEVGYRRQLHMSAWHSDLPHRYPTHGFDRHSRWVHLRNSSAWRALAIPRPTQASGSDVSHSPTTAVCDIEGRRHDWHGTSSIWPNPVDGGRPPCRSRLSPPLPSDERRGSSVRQSAPRAGAASRGSSPPGARSLLDA